MNDDEYYDEEEEGADFIEFEATRGVGNMWWMILTLAKSLPTANMYQGVVGLVEHLKEADPGEAFFPSEIVDIFLQIAATGTYEDPFADVDGDPITEDNVINFMDFLSKLPESDEDHPDGGPDTQ